MAEEEHDEGAREPPEHRRILGRMELGDHRLDFRRLVLGIEKPFHLRHVTHEERGPADLESGEDEDDETLIEQARQREVEMDAAALIAVDPLKWLFNRLSFQARLSLAQPKRDNWTVQPSSILRFSAALASSLDASLVVALLDLFLAPVIRIVESTVTEEELKTLALEVQGLFQGLVPISAFNNTYSQLKRRQDAKRQERKTQRLMRGIQNPEAEAARKGRKNLKNHQARKRRNEENLRKREAGGGRATSKRPRV